MKSNDNHDQIELSQLLAAYQQAIDFNIICSITDTQGIIVYVNNRFCEVSQFFKQELLGQNHRIINSGYHSKEFFRNMWETIAKGEIWCGEVRSKAKDGSFFWLDSTIIPIFDSNGKIKQYFSLRIPIDDKKKLEKYNEMRIKALRKMLFQVSHKVRQPVTQILGIADVLESSILSQEELSEIIEGMKNAALLLDRFTKELNKFMTKQIGQIKD